MSTVEMNAYEAVLRMCADAAPHAWHPQLYARRSGTPLEQVNAILKQLWDRGLLEKGPPHSDYGPSLRLSPAGWQVLNDPAALRRLCDTAAFMPAADRPDLDPRRTAEVIDSLRTGRVAYVTWLLLGANILVFLIGLYLAYRVGPPVAMSYLGGTKTLIASAIFLGLFAAFNVRALSRYFNSTVRLVVLLGVLYLANKYDLFIFISGGPADAIRHQCGLLTATDWQHGEWWRALTACFVHLGLLHLMGNMLMLVMGGWFIERMWGSGRFLVIYLLAGVTGSLTGLASIQGGIAGASGALCGLVAAEAVWVAFNGKYLPRKLQQEWWNNLTLNFMLLVAISFVGGVSFWGHAGGALAGAAAAVCLHYQRFGPPLWRWAALLGLIPIPLAGLYYLNHEQARWQKPKVQEREEQPRAEPKKRDHPRENPEEKNDPAKEVERRAATEFAEKQRPEIAKRLNTAQNLFNSDLLDYLGRDPAEWRETTLKKYRADIDTNREQLDKLVERMQTLAPFPNEEITTEVERASAYATELGKLLALAKVALQAGDKETDDEKAALKKQEAKVKELRKVWQALLDERE